MAVDFLHIGVIDRLRPVVVSLERVADRELDLGVVRPLFNHSSDGSFRNALAVEFQYDCIRHSPGRSVHDMCSLYASHPGHSRDGTSLRCFPHSSQRGGLLTGGGLRSWNRTSFSIHAATSSGIWAAPRFHCLTVPSCRPRTRANPRWVHSSAVRHSRKRVGVMPPPPVWRLR